MTREQFEFHVKSTQTAFRRFLCALSCGDTMLADDIAQESYIKAYLDLDNLRANDKFKSWIYRIGYNTFINHKRSSHTASDLADCTDIAANDKSDTAFLYQELYSALDSLSSKERTSILLHYMEGYSIRETAEIVGATEDAVKQHLSRGRIHLRKILNISK